MTSKSKIVTGFLSRIYLEFIRIMPQLVLLFIVYFVWLELLTISQASLLSSLPFGGTAEMGDLVRGQSRRYLSMMISTSNNFTGDLPSGPPYTTRPRDTRNDPA